MTNHQDEFECRKREIPRNYELVATRQTDRAMIQFVFELGTYSSLPETVAEQDFLASITRQIELPLNDPGADSFFHIAATGARHPSCVFNAGLLFRDGGFHTLPHATQQNPERGRWGHKLRFEVRLVEPAALWPRLEEIFEVFAWGAIESAFGGPEPLETIREAARARINAHLEGMSPRAKSVFFAACAVAEVLGEFSTADLGALTAEIFADELDRVIGSASIAEVAGLVESLVMIE